MVTLKKISPYTVLWYIHVFQNTIYVDSTITMVTKCTDQQICMLNTYTPIVYLNGKFLP